MRIKQIYANTKEKEISKDGKKFKVNDKYITIYTDDVKYPKVYLNYIDLLKAIQLKIEYLVSKDGSIKVDSDIK
jgi:hypothetical protein